MAASLTTGHISQQDRGFLLGDGVFDTMLVFSGRPFGGKQHFERLAHFAAEIAIEISSSQVEEAVFSFLAEHPEMHAGILRTTITRGESRRGLWPQSCGPATVCLKLDEWNPQLLGGERRAVLSPYRRHSSCISSRIKSLCYLDNIMSARHAADAGANEALIMNEVANICCATTANVFIIRADQVTTPPVADGVVPGIIRDLLCRELPKAGLSVGIRSVSEADLLSADHVLITNSVRLLCKVTLPGNDRLGSGATDVIAKMYEIIVKAVQADCGIDLPDFGRLFHS